MTKKFSQREARSLWKRVLELESEQDRQRNAWVADYPGGHHIGTLIHHDTAILAHLARKLGHAVVVTANGDDILFYAIRRGAK